MNQMVNTTLRTTQVIPWSLAADKNFFLLE